MQLIHNFFEGRLAARHMSSGIFNRMVMPIAEVVITPNTLSILHKRKAFLTRYNIGVGFHEYFRSKDYSDFEYGRSSFIYNELYVLEFFLE
jgi:hypothetical protein